LGNLHGKVVIDDGSGAITGKADTHDTKDATAGHHICRKEGVVPLPYLIRDKANATQPRHGQQRDDENIVPLVRHSRIL